MYVRFGGQSQSCGPTLLWLGGSTTAADILASSDHCVDDLASFPGVDSASTDADEARLALMADVVVCSSVPLCRRMTLLGARDVRYWPNPANVEAFKDTPITANTDPVVLGFVGAVQEHKIDFELVRARRRAPDLAHPVGRPLSARDFELTLGLSELPANVELIGPSRAIVYLQSSHRSPWASFPTDLIRVHGWRLPDESLRIHGEWPTHSLHPLPSLVGEVPHIRSAPTPRNFGRVRTGPSSAVRQRMMAREFAMEHSWTARISQATGLLEGFVGHV